MADGQKGCGLEIILTALCFIDLDMNGSQGNIAKLLPYYFPELPQVFDQINKYPGKLDWVIEICWNLYTLHIGDDISLVSDYFEAALASRYVYMMIVTADNRNKIHGHEYTNYWRRDYDPTTGFIQDTKTYEWINVRNSDWYLCQPEYMP